MKNCELLDLIGEAGEEYVRAADGEVVRPRFHWKAAAAAAACAALVFGAAYPFFNKDAPLENASPLHNYIVMEGGSLAATGEDVKAPAGGGDIDMPGQGIPAPDPNQPPRGEGPGEPAYAPAPSQEEASAQYDRLLRQLGGVDGREPAAYPGWFAGMWLDSGWPDSVSRLTVAIVDGFRTPELEEEIQGWCGGTGEVLFRGAKYSKNYLDSLMNGISRIFKEQNVRISSAYGVYVTGNYLGLDFFGEAPGDETLAALAELDPEGDAIRVQVFFDRSLQVTDELVKGPAPEPVDPATRPTPAATEDGGPLPTPADGSGGVKRGQDAPADTVPGGAYVGGLPEANENAQPAHYDLLPLDG